MKPHSDQTDLIRRFVDLGLKSLSTQYEVSELEALGWIADQLPDLAGSLLGLRVEARLLRRIGFSNWRSFQSQIGNDTDSPGNSKGSSRSDHRVAVLSRRHEAVAAAVRMALEVGPSPTDPNR